MRALLLFVAGTLGCSKAGPSAVDPPPPVTTTPSPAFQPAPAKAGGVTVQMTAATLADDCGGAPPFSPPPRASMKQEKAAAAAKSDAKLKAKRRCEQTSMQLSVVAAADATPTQITVKKVELFDEGGASLGELAASSPTVWAPDDGQYKPWDQQIAPAQDLSVSYVLAQPSWDDVEDRRNKTYVLKAVVTVGGADQNVQQNVDVSAPTSLPANVKT